jgi:hypothetical protein
LQCVRGFLGSVLPTHGYPVIEATCPVEATEKFADVTGWAEALQNVANEFRAFNPSSATSGRYCYRSIMTLEALWAQQKN